MYNIVLTIILIILSYQPRILTAPTFCGQNLSHVMLIRASCAKFWPICIKSIQRVLPSLFVLTGNLIWPELINQHYLKIMVQKAKSRHLAITAISNGVRPLPFPKICSCSCRHNSLSSLQKSDLTIAGTEIGCHCRCGFVEEGWVGGGLVVKGIGGIRGGDVGRVRVAEGEQSRALNYRPMLITG